jgi:hypothetical protein
MNNVVDDAIIHIPQYEKAPSPDCPACIRGSIAVMQGAFIIRAHTHKYVKPDQKALVDESKPKTFDEDGNEQGEEPTSYTVRKAPPPEFWLTLSPACFKAPPLYVVPMDHLRQATGEQLKRLKLSREQFDPSDQAQIRAGIVRYRDQLQAQVDELNRQLAAQDQLSTLQSVLRDAIEGRL